MKTQLSKKETVIIVVGFMFLLSLIVASYLIIIQPKREEINALDEEIKTTQKLLTIYDLKPNNNQGNEYKNINQLKAKVPVSPLFEKFMYDVEKSELISESIVINMELQDEQDATQLNKEQKQIENPLEKQLDVKEETEGKTTPQIKLPSGMKKWTVTLTVESPKYKNLEKFIEALEATQRIVVIDTIDFTDKKEITSGIQESGNLVYNVSVTAFYMPEITK
ncbi:MAG: Pilus assembly protein PilO [Bacillales bacterium]|jgi:type IV pilus assembly protein PilO|nr:Pilus assembly protein PilO [Bacillales bacterium]